MISPPNFIPRLHDFNFLNSVCALENSEKLIKSAEYKQMTGDNVEYSLLFILLSVLTLYI